MKLKTLKADLCRWEFCPHCFDGFPTYLGKDKDNTHHYECTLPDCEAYYKVEDGKGAWDLKIGMELSEESIYYERCDICKRMAPVKVKDLRFTCRKCNGLYLLD